LLISQTIHYKTAGVSIHKYFDAGYLSSHGGLLIQMTTYAQTGGLAGSILFGGEQAAPDDALFGRKHDGLRIRPTHCRRRILRLAGIHRMSQIADSPRTLRRDIVFAFALALACYLAWLIRDVLVLLYVSALFAVVLSPVVRFTSQLHIRGRQPFKGSAIFLLLLVVAGAFTAFGFLALPPVISDLQGFAREMPTRLPILLEKLKTIPLAQHLDTTEMSTRLQDFVSQAATYLLYSLSDWAGKLFDFIMGFILTIYFILEGDRAYQWFLSFFPRERRERLDKTLQRAEIRMGKWLLGQGSLMLILGVASTIVYLSLNVRYAYALGVLTGLLNVIPVLGAAICIALALLVAAIDSWGRVLGIAIFYVIYLWIENSYLTPRIMKSRVGLPGLAILVALVIGSALEGVLGAMVSVPTAVLVAVLLDEYLVSKDAA
jgi:predicted PurR-regulated permease PerM